MQADGNLVLYKVGGGVIWSAGTVGSGADSAVMKNNGQFAIQNGANVNQWDAGTNGHHGAFLHLQNDQNLLVKDGSSCSLIWQTDTSNKVFDAIEFGILDGLTHDAQTSDLQYFYIDRG